MLCHVLVQCHFSSKVHGTDSTVPTEGVGEVLALYVEFDIVLGTVGKQLAEAAGSTPLSLDDVLFELFKGLKT